MLKLPFVSRGRFEDAKAVIEELRHEIRQLRDERILLSDVIAARATGVSVYGKFNVPSAPVDEEEPEPRAQSPEKDSAEPMVVKPEEVTPTRARDYVRKVARENSAAFQKTEADEQAGIALRDAVERGKRAAEANTNGGNHVQAV